MHSFKIRRLSTTDVDVLRALNAVFGEAFRERENYTGAAPPDTYLAGLLAKDHIVVLVATVDEQVVGGVVAYELEKLERQRRELYIYDLAVDSPYRRHGIATALIEELRQIALWRAVWVLYVQADYGDDAAVALYEKIGVRENVMHFDIPVVTETPAQSSQARPKPYGVCLDKEYEQK
jgi:aminoglycoside 3-N-acetyltransferase I